MTGYIPKPIPKCRICKNDADYGTLCQSCKKKLKRERKNVVKYSNRDKKTRLVKII